MTSPAPSTDSAGAPLRVLLAAGGTGGHLMPALATAEALERRRRCNFLLVGSDRDSERQLRAMVPYPAVEIRARALAGKGIPGKLRTLAGLGLSVREARAHLLAFGPDLVIATGGYVCGPTGIAAWTRRIPLLVLEQNARPGITSRWLRRLAQAVAVSFAETVELLGPRAVHTGNPIRATLPAAARRDGAPIRRSAGAGVHLLILGGSQGARGLNTMVELALPRLASTDLGLRVTHQTGKQDVERLREAYARHAIPATVTPFIKEIGEAYARADLVCSRAGATTAAELTYCGLPSVLVPFPHAAGGHQDDNARALARAGAAMVVPEQANGTPLADAILELAADPDRLATMAGASAAAGQDDAAGAVAELALGLVEARVRPRADAATPPLSPDDDSAAAREGHHRPESP